MERDLELGLKKETGSGSQDDDIFFECEESEIVEEMVAVQDHRRDVVGNDHPRLPQETVAVQDPRRDVVGNNHPHLPQETVGVQDPRRDVVDGAACALPFLIGHDLKSISKIFNAIAGTLGFGLLMAFLGLTLVPSSSILYRPSHSSCGAPAEYIARLYALVSVGLCVTITQFMASLLGAKKKETEAAAAEPPVPVMRRVCVFIAAVSQIVLTICLIWSLFLALSLRMGKMSCWNEVFRGLLFTGFCIISSTSLYVVYIGLGCVFGTN